MTVYLLTILFTAIFGAIASNTRMVSTKGKWAIPLGIDNNIFIFEN